MESSERDSTGDWLLPAAASPPSIGELDAKVELALETARASERAARSLGASAADAAVQARRAAELAERASAAAVRAVAAEPAPPPAAAEDVRRFTERADRVLRRLTAIERPRGEHPASARSAVPPTGR
mgnify:CR=1 FL=1